MRSGNDPALLSVAGKSHMIEAGRIFDPGDLDAVGRAVVEIPDPGEPVLAGGGKQPARRIERDLADATIVMSDHHDGCAGQVPDAHRSLSVADREAAARRHRSRLHLTRRLDAA